jgi:hypothetical protein
MQFTLGATILECSVAKYSQGILGIKVSKISSFHFFNYLLTYIQSQYNKIIIFWFNKIELQV